MARRAGRKNRRIVMKTFKSRRQESYRDFRWRFSKYGAFIKRLRLHDGAVAIETAGALDRALHVTWHLAGCI